jgi:hypothetical protein
LVGGGFSGWRFGRKTAALVGVPELDRTVHGPSSLKRAPENAFGAWSASGSVHIWLKTVLAKARHASPGTALGRAQEPPPPPRAAAPRFFSTRTGADDCSGALRLGLWPLLPIAPGTGFAALIGQRRISIQHLQEETSKAKFILVYTRVQRLLYL